MINGKKNTMTQAHPCLLSVNKTSKYRHFPFLENQIRIGRGDDMTYTILSSTISRCHALIDRLPDETWTITDNKSLNGIAVNNERLEPQEPRVLQDGDVVTLGVPRDTTTQPEFVYRFFTSLKVRRQPKSSGHRPVCLDDGQRSKRLLQDGNKEGKVLKRKAPENSSGSTQQQKRLKTELEDKLQALTAQLKEKEREKSAIAQQLKRERQERRAIEHHHKQQEDIVRKMDAKQTELLKEKAEAEAAMQQQVEDLLRKREAELRGVMQHKLRRLTQERQQVEERLHAEMDKAVREKDKELQHRLQEEKERLQKVIETKELEQRALESQLAQTHVEREKARADTLTAREAILSQFADTMETELQCSICSELFVKATTLNCSHAFCALCIRQWLERKKECPNCRAAVSSLTPSLVLDNYIDRVTQQLSTDMKQRRQQLMEERRATEAELDEAEQHRQAGPSGTTARRRRQGRGRRRRQGRRGRATRARDAGSPEVLATVTYDSGDSSSSVDVGGAPSSGSRVMILSESEEENSSRHQSSEDWIVSQEIVSSSTQSSEASESEGYV